MCGISGFSWEDNDLIRSMGNAIRHRGPDDRGEHVGLGASLGQMRLSIIDLSENGRQPMVNETGDVFIVVNGEIYNYLDLRAELIKRGHVFHSNSDSEVVLHGYEEWGPEIIQRLQGMYAFAIHDARNQRIMLGRDRLGIKPLYYHHNGRQLIFSGEIKAILEWPGYSRSVDLDSLYKYLGWEFVPAPKTLFKGINKLKQGHYVLFDMRTGELKETPYWELKFQPRFDSPQEAMEELRALLKTSVQRRLMSDVPLGVFLSGGLDSTTVVALMRECGVEHLRTFSIGYPDKSFSELDYANDMAEYYKTDQSVLMIDGLSIDDLEKAVWHLDEPMTDLSAIPLMLICRKAKERATVVLSGEGGDEIFCGYDRFKVSKLVNMMGLDVVPGLASLFHQFAKRLPDQPQKKGMINIAKRIAEGLIQPREGGHLRWQYFLLPGMAERLFNDQVRAEVDFDSFAPLRNILKECNSKKRLDREVFGDLKLTMADSVLMKVDKMSMSTSLEVRVPFLDHEVVELCASIPGEWKLKGLTTKHIMRETIRGLVPDRVADRGKQGYSLPVKNLVRGQLKPLMQELLTTSPLVKDYMVPAQVERLMQEHLSGAQNHNHVLWALMNAALWHRRFLEN
jgi:asparagine synthase (glutamine-hydrolysing)